MPMKMRFKDEGKKLHCDVAYHDPVSGRIAAFRGSADKAQIANRVRQAMRKWGSRKTATAMGCAHTADAMAGEIVTEAKLQAIENVADMMGWSPFHLIKKVAWDYNPAAYVARKSTGMAYNALKSGLKAGGRAIASPFRSKGGGGAPPPQGGPETPDTPDDGGDDGGDDASEGTMGHRDRRHNQQHKQAMTQGMGRELMQQYEISACSGADTLVGDYEIGDADPLAGMGFAPFLAISAWNHRRQLAKIAKSGNKRAANAAKTLGKAKGGDKDAKAKIKALDKAAKKGDPTAKDAMKRLHMVDAMARKPVRGLISQLVHDGIT